MRFFNQFLLVLYVLIVIPTCHAAAQIKAVPLDEIDHKLRDSPRPILILITADWCTYCHMQKNLIKNSKADFEEAGLLYFAELNAQETREIQLNNHRYRYDSSGASKGIHSLAVALNGSERIAFPTWIVLDASYTILFRHQGVLSPLQLKKLIRALEAAPD